MLLTNNKFINMTKEMMGIIELKEVSFFKDDTLVISEKVNSKKEFDNKTEYRLRGRLVIEEEEESWAIFSVEDLVIPHSNLTVKVTALISTEDGEGLKIWEFELIPFTEEELRNNLRDSIMSV